MIARLWLVLHALGEYFGGYDAVVLGATMVWLMTIAFLPFPTELVGRSSSSGRLVAGL